MTETSNPPPDVIPEMEPTAITSSHDQGNGNSVDSLAFLEAAESLLDSENVDMSFDEPAAKKLKTSHDIAEENLDTVAYANGHSAPEQDHVAPRSLPAQTHDIAHSLPEQGQNVGKSEAEPAEHVDVQETNDFMAVDVDSHDPVESVAADDISHQTQYVSPQLLHQDISVVVETSPMLSQMSHTSQKFPVHSDSHDDYVPEEKSDHNQTSPALVQAQMKWCTATLRSLKRHNEVGPFLRPVDPVVLGIPDYFNVIKEPMDLSTVEARMAREYTSADMFTRDVELMLHNCFTYNPPNHPVHAMGRNIEKCFQNLLRRYPKTLDELKIDVHKSGRVGSHDPSPMSARPKRDVHPPSEYLPGDSKKKKRSGYDEMRFCYSVYREVMKKQYEAFMFPFYQPVDPVALNIPTYFEVVTQPMDLSTIKKKLDQGDYEKGSEFEDDFKLMINNCLSFNRPGDDVYRMGQKSLELFNRKWNDKPSATPKDTPNMFSSRPKKRKSGHGSDMDTSTDEDEDADSIQIQMVQQQIQLLQTQLEALKQKRRRKFEKRREKSSSRRSSKGSGAPGEMTVGLVDAPPMAPPVERAPRPPPQPKKPRGNKVGRPRKKEEPDEIREITFEEKRELSEVIPTLSAEKLNRVVQIIHESMPHLKDNAGEEIELDIDSLDLVTLNRLWFYVKGNTKKKRPNADPALNATRISELEIELARMDGRMDKTRRFQGIGNDSSSDSSSDDGSDSGSDDSG